MSSEFERMLEAMVPGAGVGATDTDGPGLPAALGHAPRGLIGRGGSGWVYRAWDPVLLREVAVKVAAPQGGAATRRAVLQEAQDTARLTHPAVLPVHRVVVDQGFLCVVYRLAPTELLAELLVAWRDQPSTAWPVARRLSLLRTVVDALDAAHRGGLVHGDLKPDHVALGAHGEPYVLDWSGLAWSDGSFSGSPTHAPPEQLAGGAATPASDVYSAAALVWEVLALRPFRRRGRREELGAFVARAASAPLPPLEEVGDPTLAGTLRAALATAPTERPTAAELRAVLDAVITGRTVATRQRAQADALLAEARDLLLRLYDAEPRLQDELRVVEVQRAKIAPHAPRSDKRPLWVAEDRAARFLREQSVRWVDAYERAVQAIRLVPEDDDAHRLLADLWWERLVFCENQGFEVEAMLCLRNLAVHDRGKYAGRLRDTATVCLTTEPADATIELSRLEPRERRLTPVWTETLASPLRDHGVTVGSWVATVSAPGRCTVQVPLHPTRLETVRRHVRLPVVGAAPPGWVFVPGGTFRMGGDPLAHQGVGACAPWVDDLWVQELPVTSGDYLAFLSDHTPAERAGWLPRDHGPWGRAVTWPEDGARVGLPEGWSPAHPVVGVSLAAAERYAAWLSARLGRVVRLPTEEEWEKAARGCDGRSWPWGDAFDPAFCHMRASVPGVPAPAPVGRCETDRSVYGVRDVAGGVREWTATTWGDGRAVIRGGGWRSHRDDCRLASRGAQPTGVGDAEIGIRLVMEP